MENKRIILEKINEIKKESVFHDNEMAKKNGILCAKSYMKDK
ncbi:MAG: hypothetical protein ACRCW6_00620 [Mycoplasmoidaceae bacterium]